MFYSFVIIYVLFKQIGSINFETHDTNTEWIL